MVTAAGATSPFSISMVAEEQASGFVANVGGCPGQQGLPRLPAHEVEGGWHWLVDAEPFSTVPPLF